MSKTRHIIDLVINLINFGLVAYCVISFFTMGGEGNMAIAGTNAFMFFTIDSNILAAIGCLVVAICNVKSLASKQPNDSKTPSVGYPLNRVAFLFKWVGTVAVTITFMVVLCFLGPLMGYASMYMDTNLWLHGVCPVLCIASSLFIEKGKIRMPEAFLGLVPVVIYGAVYFVMVVVIGHANGGWYDFYMFNQGGMWPITIAVMTIVTTAISLVERIPHRK